MTSLVAPFASFRDCAHSGTREPTTRYARAFVATGGVRLREKRESARRARVTRRRVHDPPRSPHSSSRVQPLPAVPMPLRSDDGDDDDVAPFFLSPLTFASSRPRRVLALYLRRPWFAQAHRPMTRRDCASEGLLIVLFTILYRSIDSLDTIKEKKIRVHTIRDISVMDF